MILTVVGKYPNYALTTPSFCCDLMGHLIGMPMRTDMFGRVVVAGVILRPDGHLDGGEADGSGVVRYCPFCGEPIIYEGLRPYWED